MLEPDEAKRQFRSNLEKEKDAKNIVISISREKVGDEYNYHAYNVFGEEIPDYFCNECIKEHLEQYDFSMFDLPADSDSKCKNCEDNKIKLKEN